MADFRRATSDFRMNLEREVRMEEIKDAVKPIENLPRPETLARGVLGEADPTDPPPDPPLDGGTDSVH
jgi:hypothetical protein